MTTEQANLHTPEPIPCHHLELCWGTETQNETGDAGVQVDSAKNISVAELWLGFFPGLDAWDRQCFHAPRSSTKCRPSLEKRL